jgi:hypothetical protein
MELEHCHQVLDDLLPHINQLCGFLRFIDPTISCNQVSVRDEEKIYLRKCNFKPSIDTNSEIISA